MRIEVEEYVGVESYGWISPGPGRTLVDSRSQVSVTVAGGTKQLDDLAASFRRRLSALRSIRDRLEAMANLSPTDAALVSACEECEAAIAQGQQADVSVDLADLQRARRELTGAEDGGGGPRDIQVRVHAERTDGAPIYVYNWTHGKGPSGGDTSLTARIDQLIEDAGDVEAAEQEVEQSAAEIVDTFGDATNLPQGVSAFVSELRADREMAHSLMAPPGAPDPPADGDPVSRALNGFLPPGRIEFGLTETKRRDKIDLDVDFVRRGGEGEPDEVIDGRQFNLQLDDFGWRAHVRPQLIFFRSTDGDSDAKRFQSNAAALIDWSYRYREPEGGWGKFINGLEPGVGIHVASIDQGESSLEVGTGLNLSFKQGLFSVGWGFNLSERDHYYFVGGNLFRLFDELQGIVGE
ncbi:MAG: hypothetical protein GY711_31650 [bacterium]|nr:hypothetical protein [bacterium]